MDFKEAADTLKVR